jgi:hypothetical protein
VFEDNDCYEYRAATARPGITRAVASYVEILKEKVFLSSPDLVITFLKS